MPAVQITYCVRWGYEARAVSLAESIEREIGADTELVRGDNGIFDVEVGSRRIFSKHDAGRFPEHEEIFAALGG